MPDPKTIALRWRAAHDPGRILPFRVAVAALTRALETSPALTDAAVDDVLQRELARIRQLDAERDQHLAGVAAVLRATRGRAERSPRREDEASLPPLHATLNDEIAWLASRRRRSAPAPEAST